MNHRVDKIGRTGENVEPHVGIFWMIATDSGAQLLAASCPLSEAEPYGDCLTYGPGHYQVWQSWRRSRELEPAARAVVRAYEYEDWPRGRVVLDRSRNRFVLYTDRQLMDAASVDRVCERFNISRGHATAETDLHYRSREWIER